MHDDRVHTTARRSLIAWTGTALGALAAALAVVTLLWHDWVEIVFHVDPDQHSGSFEWFLVVVLVTASAISFSVAGLAWRRRASAATTAP